MPSAKRRRARRRRWCAQIILIPSDNNGITAELITAMVDAARKLGGEPGTGGSTNSTNADAAAGYHPMGEEIWSQTSGRVDAYVQAVGTAHSLNGVARVLRRHNPKLHVVAAEPAETPVLSGGLKGSHRIEGIGIGFIPPHWRPRRGR
jgi:cysteine synthase A